MLIKLAMKNVKKAFGDYLIYFFTLMIAVSVFYMFNSVYAQQGIMNVTQGKHEALQMLSTALEKVSIFVSVIFGFLIIYANNFFIKRRKKELGIYMTVGMDKKQISLMIILETFFIALFALVIGIIVGVVLSQFMSLFTAKIFEADLTQYKFVFAKDAVLRSVLYFGLIFIIVILFHSFAISRLKLIDLIYGNRKNEKLKNTKISFFIFLVSIATIGSGYYLILKNGLLYSGNNLTIAITLGCIGTLLFFYSLAGFLVKFIRTNKSIYYKDINMFSVRQISSKVNTNFVSISIICLILFFTINIFVAGYSFQDVLSKELRNMVHFDFSIVDFKNEEDTDYSTITQRLPKEMVINNKDIKSYAEYAVYYNQNMGYENLQQKLKEEDDATLGENISGVLKLSEYNRVAKMKGEKELVLDKNTYGIIISDSQLYGFGDKLAQSDIKLNVGKDQFNLKGNVIKSSISNNYEGFLVILPDEYIEHNKDFILLKYNLNIDCVNKEAQERFNGLLKNYSKGASDQEKHFSYYTSRIEIYEESITTKALISFLGIYIGIVLMVTCATILAIQQLSQASDNKYRYNLLRKLGVEESMLNKATFIQIGCYFIFPAIVAIIHCFVGIYSIVQVFNIFIKVNIWDSIFKTCGFLFTIYVMYFAITYFGSKRILKK